MARKFINRTTIVSALETEPLRAGGFEWVQDDPRGSGIRCDVCAVGAVVRRALRVSAASEAFNDLCGRLTEDHAMPFAAGDEDIALAAGNYFGALSMFFENLVSGTNHATEKQRRELIQWVKDNLPERVPIPPEDC